MDADLLRIIDVNCNRATEGLRVVEEVIRHTYRDEILFNQFRIMRHTVNQLSDNYSSKIFARESGTDPGRNTVVPFRLDQRSLIIANIKRAQEAMRVLEEVSLHKQEFMNLRFDLYSLEKIMSEKFYNRRFDASILKLYIVSAEVSVLLKAAAQGVRVVQLRDKKSNTEQLLQKAFAIKHGLQQINQKVYFIMNDRPDIARIAAADGVHIGQDDMTVAQARSIIGQAGIVGKSTHCIEQAIRAQDEGADYIGVGPVWETPTKLGRTAVGLDYVRQVVDQTHVPFVAIGGINLENIDEVLAAGAKNVAVVRAVDQISSLLNKLL